MENNEQNKANTGKARSLLLLCSGVFLAAFLPAGALFHLLYERMVKKPPVFFDLIIEDTALTGMNKAGEITLFRILCAATLFFIFLAAVLLPRLWKGQKADTQDGFSPILPLLWLIPCLVYYIVGGVFSLPLFFMALFSLAAGRLPFERFSLSLLPLLCYYALLALATAGSFLYPLLSYRKGQRDPAALSGALDRLMPSQTALYLTALILSALVLLLLFLPGKKKLSEEQADRRMKLFFKILQLPIPLLLCVWFHDLYSDHGILVRIPYATGYYLFFGILLLGSFLAFFLSGKKQALIAYSTPLVLFLYRSYQACPMFAQPDQHHHGEQLIPWQQIVSLGQGAYKSYTPVSGLFPMVNGFIQHVLFGGTVSDYAPAISATTAVFAAMTILLVIAHVGADRAVLFAVLFALPAYNRQYMVLPLLLLFFLPTLRKKPALFCILWIFGCFLGGLYYPLFGAAVLIGTLPLFCRAAYSLIRDARERNDKTDPKRTPQDGRRASVWPLVLFAGAAFFCILLSLPLLLRMAKHTLTYSSQTILADGISLAGQTAPGTFLSGLPLSENAKNALYLWYRFFLPILCLWPAAFLAGLLLSPEKNEPLSFRSMIGRFSRNSALFLKALAVILTLSVSYSYTLVRADRGVILARTGPVLVAVAGLFMAAALLSKEREPFLAQGGGRTSLFLSVMTGLCLSLPFACYAHVNDMKNPYLWTYPDGNDALVFEDVSKLFADYEVPESFSSLSQVSLSDTSRLGKGYMVSDQLHYLTEYDEVKKKAEAAGFSDLSYMGYDGQGFYYYLNTKACATGYLPVARSFDAQKEILDVAKKERPVIFPLDPQKSYYICRWLFSEEADYLYCSRDHCFYPAEIYRAVTGKETGDPYEEDPSDPFASQPAALGAVCANFGASRESLLDGSEQLMPLTEDDLQSASSVKADVLCLPLDLSALQKAAEEKGFGGNISQLELWLSDETALCSFDAGNGNLLIPVGMHPAWFLAKNASPQEPVLTARNGEDDSFVCFSMEELISCLDPSESDAAGFYRIH